MMSGAGSNRRKKWECLFCLKKVGNDRKTRECTENIFHSCFRHLPSDVIGKTPNFGDFQNNNGPFCALCFQSAQELSKKNELLAIIEKEVGDFVTSLTVSILQNRNSPVNIPLEYESNIEVQILQKVHNYTIELQEEGSTGVFDCYEEEVQEIDVEVDREDCEIAAVATVEDEENEEEIQEIEEEIEEIEIDEQNNSRDSYVPADESEDEDQGVQMHQKGEAEGQCTTANTNKLIMRKIILQKTPSGKVFLTIPCECGMPLESEQQMKDHSLSCDKFNSSEMGIIRKSDIRYRCGICGFLAKSIDELGEHKMRHAKKYECKKCKEKFRLKVQLKAHRKAVHAVHYQCSKSKCEKTFHSEKLRLDHEDEHVANENGQDTFMEKSKLRKCEICGEILKTKTSLNYHMLSKHSNERPYSCSVCHRSFKLKRFLNTHMQTHLQVKNFLCGDQSCGKSFAIFRLLEQHTKLEHTDDNFKCELCEFKTLNQKRMDIHKARCHDLTKQFECSFCGIRVSALTTLQNHERIHTGEKPHKCNVCEESFRTQILLKLHTNRKHEEGKFKCSSCDYVAGAQFMLDSHSLVHSENKPFECEACGKTFKAKSSMVKHERLTCKAQQ